MSTEIGRPASMPGGLSWLSRIASVAGVVLRAAIVVFMVGPVVCLAVLSFGQEHILVFPPQSWGFGLYQEFFHSSYWVGAILTSLKIGIPSAILAVAVASPVAWALSRARVPFPNFVQMFGLIPLILPSISYAIALYALYLKVNLLYTNIGLVLADAALGVPFVLFITKAALDRIPLELELTAMTLGATRLRAVAGITLQLLRPALAASLVFAFMASFDESTFVQFLGGPDQTTLPKAMFDSARVNLSPAILAVGTVLVLGSGVLTLIAARLRSGGMVQ